MYNMIISQWRETEYFLNKTGAYTLISFRWRNIMCLNLGHSLEEMLWQKTIKDIRMHIINVENIVAILNAVYDMPCI